MSNVKIEIVVDSIPSALEAIKGGASRLELCSALGEGGLTPSLGTLKAIKSHSLSIPIYCMLRPRKGNDFNYSVMEMQAVLYDLEALALAGADGFVFGALDENHHVNVNHCSQVIKMANNLPVTFHRAFDVTPIEEIHDTVDIIKKLKFERILTSGFKQYVEDGLDIVTELISKHEDIIIMPGSGIKTKNLEKILLKSKCKEFHTSARPDKIISDSRPVTISMGKYDNDCFESSIASAEVIREMLSICVNIKIC